jgi:hypothetical protein|tara:strand:- start:220 stop:453 length:234 start_codon:yes stop_codon:yes gene_type:complete
MKNEKKNFSNIISDDDRQTITCHFCFEIFEVDLQFNEISYGTISEIYDCVICCNPNKIEYKILNKNIHIIAVGDGNE